MRVYGITGWKDQGKTTLVSALVSHFAAAGLTVSTIKHAHHAFDIDQEGRDSYRHREAGAQEVVLASKARFAVMHELRGAPEWELPALLGKLAPADLVLVEGYKNAAHPKIEVFRKDKGRAPLALEMESVRALAGDPGGHAVRQPVFALEDVAGMADFIRDELGL